MKRLFIAAILLFPLAPALLAGETPCGGNAPESLVKSLLKQAPGLKADVLRLALNATRCASAKGLVKRPDLLTVIDYSLPSDKPRLFTFNVAARQLIFRELVAHGKNSGGNLANFFSNSPGSLATSLGLFVTANTYMGSNGYSLRLRGLEEGVNDMAWDRAIVMHGATYVSRGAISALGRLGRSWGCPAVRAEMARKIIDTVKGGSPIFAYYPDKNWLQQSVFFRRGNDTGTEVAAK
jgi:hypothetical protein